MLKKAHKAKECRSGDTVIEDLEQHAIQRSRFLEAPSRIIPGELQRRKNPKQAIAEVIDRRVRKHPLDVALGKGRISREYDRGECQPEQRSQDGPYLIREQRHENT